MLHKFITYVTLCAIYIVFVSPALAEDKYNIAAVVNGDPITTFDLNERMDVIIATSRLQDSIQLRQQLAHQALQTLINENLQRQNAEKYNIKASQEDINFAIADIERRNNLPAGGFAAFAYNQRLTEEALISQIRAQIIWKKILTNVLRPKIYVSKFEIEDKISQLKSSKSNVYEVHLSEILLPFDKESSQKTIDFATKLITEIENGADFGNIAKQFSQGSTAADGGAIGWLPQEQLSGQLKELVIATKDDNLIPKPIASEDGIRIVKLGKRRSVEKEIDPQAIENMLIQQKMELESKRYMKELRSKAFIEVRI